VSFLFDIHVHTNRFSPCSHIDPDRVVRQAVKAGLSGVVITEHQHQWPEADLAGLVRAAAEPGFVLLGGFEYTSTQGDILVYGLHADQTAEFRPGMRPAAAVKMAHDLGGVCVAAHPTRAGMGFDDAILSIPFDAIEVQSGNMRDHEQRLAAQLAAGAGLRPIAASDAHLPTTIGAYATEFDNPIQTMQDLVKALRFGQFRPTERAIMKAGAM
jgi:predicted metal-dependent phosphoesterase TrpH